MNNRKTKLLLLICFLNVIQLQAMGPEKPTDAIEDIANQPSKKRQRVIESPVDHSLVTTQETPNSPMELFSGDLTHLSSELLTGGQLHNCCVEPFSTERSTVWCSTLPDWNDDNWRNPVLGCLGDDFNYLEPLVTPATVGSGYADPLSVSACSTSETAPACASGGESQNTDAIDASIVGTTAEKTPASNVTTQKFHPRRQLAYVARKRFERHTDEIEPKILGFVCPWQKLSPGCSYSCQSRKELVEHVKEHLRQQHGDQKDAELMCPYCGITFATHSSKREIQWFIYHTYSKKHLNHRSYQCSECASTFIQLGALYHHAETHHCRIAKFSCACKQMFGQHCDWKRHITQCPQFEAFAAKKFDFACPCGHRCRLNEIESHSRDCSWTLSGVFICPCRTVFSATEHEKWAEHQTHCAVAQKHAEI